MAHTGAPPVTPDGSETRVGIHTLEQVHIQGFHTPNAQQALLWLLVHIIF